MVQMIWRLSEIEPYMDDIRALFAKNADHKHAQNYSEYPLFEYTKYARMGWDQGRMVYYSAGVERPEYNGSIRVICRHTRDRDYDFGGYRADLRRGLDTLDQLTQRGLELGYTDVWVSREESPELLEYFARNSKYTWRVAHEAMPGSENWDTGVQYQYVLRIQT
jgi:hypothetical protein